MEKINVLLVDDEYLALQLLENFANKLPELAIVAKTKSPIEALDILNKEKIDLLFLDIQMPTLSGLNLLKTLKEQPATVFTTAYADYALDAFDLNVVDYLLKPFAFERFLQAVNKAKEQILNRRQISLPTPVENVQTPLEYLSVKADSKIIKVFLDDILFIEGLREYVRIVCKDEKIVTFERLKNLEATLPDSQFLRVHKSYLINISKVKSIEGNLLTIASYQVPISRGKKDIVVKQVF
jgi:DNA-binding LytR/AlgR family response regulator